MAGVLSLGAVTACKWAIGHVRKCRAVTDVGGHGDEDKPWM